MLVSVCCLYADKIIVLQYLFIYFYYNTVKKYCISVMRITFEHENSRIIKKTSKYWVKLETFFLLISG